MRGMTFQQRAEIILIGVLALGFVLIAQQASMALYQIGLGLVIIATFLEIAVGNVPIEASVGKALRLIVLFLAIIAGVFALGIFLVPYLTALGR